MLNLEDLDEKTQQKLGLVEDEMLKHTKVTPKVAALGKVLGAISKLQRGEALWVLDTAHRHVRDAVEMRGGYRKGTKERNERKRELLSAVNSSDSAKLKVEGL